MHLDYEDFESGGMTLHNPSLRRPRLPFSMYKLTAEFRQKQMPKPMYASRDAQKSELRVWETKHGHVNEVGGRRIYIGSCDDCDGLVMEIRDVSGPEFRGQRSRGWRGRWPVYCDDCRERRRQESIQRRRAAKREADRLRIAEKRIDELHRRLDEEDEGSKQWTEGYWYRDERGEDQWMPGSWMD